MRKPTILAATLCSLAFAVPAHATGGYQCKTADGSDLEISVGFGHVPGAPIIATRLLARGKAIAVHAPQWWLDGEELRLVLTDADALKTLAIVRARASGAFYDGSVWWQGKRRWIRCKEA